MGLELKKCILGRRMTTDRCRQTGIDDIISSLHEWGTISIIFSTNKLQNFKIQLQFSVQSFGGTQLQVKNQHGARELTGLNVYGADRQDGQCLERQINVRNQGVTVKNQTECDLTWYTHAGNSPLLRTAEHASPNAILIKSVTVCLIAPPRPKQIGHARQNRREHS